MKLDFGILFDILFPPSEDEKMINTIDPATFLLKFNPRETRDGIVALSSFKDPQVRAAIHLVKFHAHEKSAKLLSQLFKRYLDTLPHQRYHIIPIPLSAKRGRERGHNQTHTIAQQVQSKRYQLSPGMLIRATHTPPQTSLRRKDRIKNMKKAFQYRKQGLLEGEHLILFDDVTTTGSTLREAKKALKMCGAASIRMVALAH